MPIFEWTGTIYVSSQGSLALASFQHGVAVADRQWRGRPKDQRAGHLDRANARRVAGDASHACFPGQNDGEFAQSWSHFGTTIGYHPILINRLPVFSPR